MDTAETPYLSPSLASMPTPGRAQPEPKLFPTLPITPAPVFLPSCRDRMLACRPLRDPEPVVHAVRVPPGQPPGRAVPAAADVLGRQLPLPLPLHVRGAF